jgi:hypothetical protein
MRALKSVIAVTCLLGLVLVPLEAAAGPVAHQGFTPPTQIPPSWIGPAASPTLSNLKPGRETVGYQDQRRYGTSTSERTPLCISQNGWIGGAYVFRAAGQPDRAYCVVNDGTGKLDVDAPALLLEPRAGVPQNWLRWSSSQLDPRGAAIVFEQDSGRQLRACAATEGTATSVKTVYGYVGDDGRCYGVELDGFSRVGSVVQALGDRKGYDSFMLLMKGEMTGDALLPSEGWLTVKNALLPRGVLHRVGRGDIPLAQPIACRGKQGNDTWPGHLDESTKRCQLFTSYNGTTGRASVADYEVVRYARCQTGSGPSVAAGTLGTADGSCTTSSGKTQSFWPYRTGRMPTSNGQYSTVAGKSYYLCGASTNHGTKHFLGFTNMVFPHTSQLNGCTDGTNSAQAKPDNSSPATRVWLFPAPGDDRG